MPELDRSLSDHRHDTPRRGAGSILPGAVLAYDDERGAAPVDDFPGDDGIEQPHADRAECSRPGVQRFEMHRHGEAAEG